MKLRFLPLLLGVGALLLLANLSTGTSAEENTARIKRGEYLVENVAVCTDCHTERDWKGTLNREKWLRGNTLEFKPTRFMPWGPVAPDIAGLPQFKTDEEAITFFMTGKNAAGKEPRPPMVKTKLTREDAQAVVVYLRSLKPATK